MGLLLGVSAVQAVAVNDGAKVDEAIDEIAENQAMIDDKRSEIEELDKQIEQFQQREASSGEEAKQIDRQIRSIKGKLEKARLELKQTELNMAAVKEEKEETVGEIEQLELRVEEKQAQLKELLRLLFQKEQKSIVLVWLDSGSFSEMMAKRNEIQRVQDESMMVVQELRQKVNDLRVQEEQLEQQENDLGQLTDMLGEQQEDLSAKKSEQAVFLTAKKEEQARYKQKIAAAEAAQKEIEQEIFTLRDAGIKISLTEAVDMARYAGQLTGVRPALLLGVLKVESNMGKSVGSGKYPDDMQPASREAFLRVTAKLGLDPNTAPISARPKSMSGWGGAMGPGQFMPATWEGIEPRVAQLMGKSAPNPYELTDAFVATAMLLADKGATSAAGEYEAVNRYLAGPNWQRFTWYGDRVMAVAKEYEA